MVEGRGLRHPNRATVQSRALMALGTCRPVHLPSISSSGSVLPPYAQLRPQLYYQADKRVEIVQNVECTESVFKHKK